MTKEEVVPILGGIATMGEYYIQVFFTPSMNETMPEEAKRKFRLQLDTGSSSLVIAGEGCENCTSRIKRAPYAWHSNQVVDCFVEQCTEKFCDSTVMPNACGFRLRYGDNTPQYNLEATGVVAEANIRLGSSTSKEETVFAYIIQREIGAWPTRVDGIFGLAFERLNCNPNCFPVAWRQFAHRSNSGFTICLGDEGGQLKFLQEPFKGQLRLPLLMGKVFTERTFYAVKSLGIAIVDEKNNNKYALVTRQKEPSRSMLHANQVAIIDTGTTLLILPKQMFANLKLHLQTNFCHLPGVCTRGRTIFDFGTCLSKSPVGSFPTLALVFANQHQVILIPPELYFIQYAESVYCLGIQPSGGNEFIVGDAVLRGFQVAFEEDAITFAAKPGRCGKVHGLDAHKELILTHGVDLRHIPEISQRESEPVSWTGLVSILVFWIVAVSLWRIFFRRQVGYDRL